MQKVYLVLAFLLMSSTAHADDMHAVGSRCSPMQVQNDHTVIHTACSVIYMPAGEWPQKAFYEDLPWQKNRNRLVPARPVTAEAAPK